jgi:2-polyprenyl-6-methoxyphenol hydroxylase-like FAD-dependent oxidoreductase
MKQDSQVIIVGGGPVGAAMAVALGLRGISCALIERHLLPQHIPKGQNLSQRSMENLYFWEVSDEVRAARVLPPDFPIGGITAYGDLSSDHWFAPAGRESVAPFYSQKNERLPQYLTEEVLRRKLTSLPSVTTMFGWTAESVEQDDSGVRIAISKDGEPQVTLTADYVVGCDGAHSLVRKQFGIKHSGTDFEQKVALVVFRSNELRGHLRRFPDRTTYRVLHPKLKGVWQFFGRIDAEVGWFFHAPVPDDTTPDNFDFHGLMERASGFTFDCEFDYIGFWALRVSVADTYRRGRAFLAGDSAHSHPPYGAFGLNSGLDDVANLAWKLSAALDGWGGEILLDSYSEKRRPIFWETGEKVIAGGIKEDGSFLVNNSPERDLGTFLEGWKQLEERESIKYTAYEPHYDGSNVVLGAPLQTTGVDALHSKRAQPGHHLAPQVLSSGKNIYEELGTGFTLMPFDSDETTIESFRKASQSTGVPLKIIEDTLEGGREGYESRLVLVRPDQYVAWAGNSQPDDMTALLHKVTGRKEN